MDSIIKNTDKAEILPLNEVTRMLLRGSLLFLLCAFFMHWALTE